tara:strand:- start:4080 stop:6992 length:2913 start_codon:yes stop_codon:yes gene_type:complete
MAVNKNFVVKNGLEVGTDLILANTTNSRVGIGTSLPTDTLHVNGGIAGTDFVISGIATIPTLNSTTGTITNLSATTISMGSTAVINSARQLQNIASLDATTTATIEAAIEAGPNTFANLNITGVSTFVGLATFGSGLEVQSGVSTFTGAVDINGGITANTLQVEDLTINKVVTVGAGGELQDSANLGFDGYTLTPAGVLVTGVTTSTGLIDANGGLSVSGNTTLDSAVIGGIGTFNSDGANILGIVTATAFHGDISNATGVSSSIVASVGIQSGGVVVGAGITGLNFVGAGNSILVNGSDAGIVDISIAGGGGAGAATSVGGNAPVDPELGQLWYNNTTARTFVYYDEVQLGIGASSYWVDASPFDMQGQFIEKTGDNMGGALGFAAGTTGNPGLFVNGSTNTGIYSPAANEFGFVTSGVERIRINATGTNIVGTTTVTGNINAVDGVFTGNVTVGGTLTKQDVTNVDSIGVVTARQGVYFGNAGAGTLIQGTSGGIGINSSSPVGTLDVTTTAGTGSTVFIYAANHNTSVASQAELRFGYAHSGSPEGIGYIKLKENGTNAFDGNLTFGVPTNNGSGGSVTNDVLTIKGSNQNVGIGTDIPQNSLHIEQPGGATIRLTRLTNNASNNAQISFSGTDVNFANNGGASGNIKFSNNGSEKLRIGASGQLGIGGANYGTAGQVLKSAGNSTTVTWGDATVGVSSAGTSIGNATVLNFIGAGNTFAVDGSTVDISIAGGGGGGSGDFNTGLSGEFHGTAVGIGSTVFTFPSTAGKKYILRSLLATNVATANTEVNVIGAFDFNGGERSYMGYNLPIPVGMAAELLRQPQVLNPSDKILLRSTDIDRNGVDSVVEYYGTYETLDSGTDYVGVGLGANTLNNTNLNTLYTSTGAPSVLQSIRIANISDAGPKPITVQVVDGGETIRLVENLIIPKYGSVEILDNQKRIASGAIIKVQLDEASTMGVQLSAKKITV